MASSTTPKTGCFSRQRRARLMQRPSAAQALLLGDLFYLDLPLDGRFEKLLMLVASPAAAV